MARSTNLDSSANCDSQPAGGKTEGESGGENFNFLFLSSATGVEGGLAESEDNEISSDVNKEVLIGGDTDNNRWAFSHLSLSHNNFAMNIKPSSVGHIGHPP